MKKSIVFIYNSFNDPLFQGNLFQHLLLECEKMRFQFLLITFEQTQYQLSPSQIKDKKSELLNYNIYWYPLKWHSGRLIIIKKIYDLINAFLLVFKLHLKERPTSIISLGTVSGGFAYIIKKIFSYKLYAYQFEPHSQFMADFNIWPRKRLSYKLLNWFEKEIALNAEIIATGTDLMISQLKKNNAKGAIYKLPSCVNDDLFVIDEKAGNNIRVEYGIEKDERVIIYVGKFGGIYYDEEIFNAFEVLQKEIPRLYIIILTPDNQEAIKIKLLNAHINRFFVGKTAYHNVFKFLNAADIGLCAIPGLPSQKFRSPIKVGEYLLCGLPYITCEGVSEDDLVAQKYNVGVVLKEFSQSEIKENLKNIIDLFNIKNKEKNRKVGLHYRGLSVYTVTIYQIFEKLENIS